MNQESRTSGMRALLNRLDYLLLDMRSKLGLITVILNYGFAPHTPLPCEVRKGKDTTPRACSLHVQGGQECWLLPPRCRLRVAATSTLSPLHFGASNDF